MKIHNKTQQNFYGHAELDSASSEIQKTNYENLQQNTTKSSNPKSGNQATNGIKTQYRLFKRNRTK